MNTEDNFQSVQKQLQEKQNLVVFTGAGASAESGIPTFRGDVFSWWEGILGIPALFLVGNGWGWLTVPWLCWFLYDFFMRKKVMVAEPNAFHLWVAEQKSNGKNVFVMTQNVDGLHQKAGLSSDCIYECHGSLWNSVCSAKDCDTVIKAEEPRSYSSRWKIPFVSHCPACGSTPRPAAVLFYDYKYAPYRPHSIDLLAKMEEFDNENTVVLIVGLSGMVSSADGLIAHFSEADLGNCFVIDPRESKYTKNPQLKWIQEKAGEFTKRLQHKDEVKKQI